LHINEIIEQSLKHFYLAFWIKLIGRVWIFDALHSKIPTNTEITKL